MIGAIYFQAKPIQNNVRKQTSSAIRNTGDQVYFKGKVDNSNYRYTKDLITIMESRFDNSHIVSQNYLLSPDKKGFAQAIAEIIMAKGAPKFLGIGKPNAYETNYFLAKIMYAGIDTECLETIKQSIIENKSKQKIHPEFKEKTLKFIDMLKEKVLDEEEKIREELKPSLFDSDEGINAIVENYYTSSSTGIYTRIIAEKLDKFDGSEVKTILEKLKKQDPLISEEILFNLPRKTQDIIGDSLPDIGKPQTSDLTMGAGSFNFDDTKVFIQKLGIEEYL